jgi:hypothetical protein
LDPTDAWFGEPLECWPEGDSLLVQRKVSSGGASAHASPGTGSAQASASSPRKAPPAAPTLLRHRSLGASKPDDDPLLAMLAAVGNKKQGTQRPPQTNCEHMTEGPSLKK